MDSTHRPYRPPCSCQGIFVGVRPQCILPLNRFKDRWVQFRRDTEIDVRALTRVVLRSHLIDAMENYQLACIRHGERNLCFTRYLPLPSDRMYPGTGLPAPNRHLDADVADAAQRNGLSLRFVSYRSRNRKLHCVAVGSRTKSDSLIGDGAAYSTGHAI